MDAGRLLGKPNKLGGVTCNIGLASRPGGAEILLAASCYRHWGKLWHLWGSWLQGLTFLMHHGPCGLLWTIDPVSDHPKGQKLVINLSRPLEWHSKHRRCKPYINAVMLRQLRLINMFVHISYLVLHYPQNFATQTFIWKSAIFEIFANITSNDSLVFKFIAQAMDACAARNRPWQTLAFLPLLTSSLLTKIGIIYTQLLQQEKIFPMKSRSEWSAQWSLRYAQKRSKRWVKNSEQNFLPLHLAAPCKKLPVLMTLSQRFFYHKQASRRSITAAKEKRRKRKGEKKFQKSKSLKT